nr:copia protein [Tanacetum cinerariifolium]
MKAIRTKWVYKNKKDEKGIVVKNKARLVAQGHRQEQRIDYDEVFAHVARIEAIRMFLAFASFMGFIIYQIDVKSDFLYETIEEEVYISQPHGFIDPQFPNKIYKVKQSEEGIFISQDKYVAEILKKFNFSSVKTASKPIETRKPLVKDKVATDVDVHLYRSMIGSLMYLKGQPKLGLWYPRDSPFDLKAYSDSDYTGTNLDKISITGVYLMDVKSSFLCGTIDEEVYVTQPPGFVDPKFPNKVYKVVKALYGLHQTPKAWYATLPTFLENSGYRKGAIDKTLFKKKDKKDIMLVQVYVDDIILGSTKKSWCDEFEELMKNMFQMSSMCELTFFLGLQLKQKEDGIFISQDMYMAEILKKFDFLSVKTASTPIETQKPLVKDEEAVDVDVHLYRSLIGSLMYLKGKPKLCLWYPKVSSFDLEAYLDSDYAGANLDRKSITEEAEYVAAAHCCGQEENAEFHQIVDFLSTCLINYALTEIGLCDRPRRQKTTLGVADAQTRFETASTRSSDPPISTGHIVGSGEDMMEQENDLTGFIPPTPHNFPLSGDHTPGSKEGRPNLLELMNICTKLSNEVLALEEEKTVQDKVITRLKLRVRRLEKKRKARTSQPMKRRLFKGRVKTYTNKSLGKDASKQGRNDDQIEELNLTNGADTEVIVKEKGSGEKDLTIARTLIKMWSEKAKEKGVAFRDVEKPPRLTRSTTTLQPLLTIHPKDKGKGVLVEKRTREVTESKKNRSRERQKQEKATIAALTEEFDEIQARMDADHELLKKQLAAERAEEKRNKPPTRTQVRNKMITYLKHM